MSALSQAAAPDLAVARFHMVESQLRPNQVRDDRILTAMGSVPREAFVSPAMASLAYIDEDIQVAPGRYLLEPMVLGRLLQEAGVRASDRVLDIAPATGYSTAVLAALAREVIALESDTALAAAAAGNLRALSLSNARVVRGDVTEGWRDDAPYDVILINGCVDFLPDTLADQLAEDGRLMTVVQTSPAPAHVAEARLYVKTRGYVSHRALFDANVARLRAFAAPPRFDF